MLKVLGIYSPERMARYLHLFEKEKAKQKVQEVPQALFQQIFVPYDIAQRSAYMCQIWGEEFLSSDMALKSPSIIKDLIGTPELFEQRVRLNKQAFTNFGDCTDFGDTSKGFNYANSLQIRYLPRTSDAIVTHSYFRSVEAHQSFVTELSQLIAEDYADHLAYGSTLPDFIMRGTDTAKNLAYSQSKLGLFPPEAKISYDSFYLQQNELYKGLVQNPRKETYGGILTLDAVAKTKLQERLRESTGKESPHPVFPYSLCRYLKGYTYYDLLKEAATAVFLKNNTNPEAARYKKESFDFVMEMIDAFSTPSSVETIPISGGQYHRLTQLMRYSLAKHDLNPEQHTFMKAEAGEYYADFTWSHELSTAIECVLRYARLAKEKDYGHDIRSRVKALH